MNCFRIAIVTTVLVALLTSAAWAVSTRTFDLDDTATFEKGEFEGTAAYSDGTVRRGVSKRRVELKDVAVAWSFARNGSTVYVGTGNDGKILKVSGDQVNVFAETKQLVVSAMTMGPGNTLYAGTLPEGRIFAIKGPKDVKEIAKPKDAEHIWALLWDRASSRLIAATGPNGKLLSISVDGKAKELYDAEQTHLVTLAQDQNGTLYAGTSDKARVLRIGSDGKATVVRDFPGNEVTSIAVRNGELAVAANDFPEVRSAKAGSKSKPGHGQVWRVSPDGNAEILLENKKEHFTRVDLGTNGEIYAATGKEGRVHRIERDRSHATWLDVDEREILAMDLLDKEPFLLTGDGAAMYWIDSSSTDDNNWTSHVLDGQVQTRFGELTWRAAGRVTFQTRSGNTDEPDDSWSEWSAAMSTPGPVRSAPARYLQVRASLGKDAVLYAATVHYLSQNRRAYVTEVSSTGTTAKKSDDSLTPPPSSTYKLEWKVVNADKDPLRYVIRYRPETSRRWRDMLKQDEILTKTKYEWNTESLPDGFYVVRVEASDDPANPADLALTDAKNSEPILVDNHAPEIRNLKISGRKITGEAVDSLGPVSKIEYAIDGNPWILAFPSDDLFDTNRERFEITVGKEWTGERIIAVRVTDAGGNVRSQEKVVTFK